MKKTTIDYLKELQELQLRLMKYTGVAWFSVSVNYEIETVSVSFHYEQIRLHVLIYSNALEHSPYKENIDRIMRIIRLIIDKLVPENS